MKILAYVHTFNDAGVIDETIQALCAQTYPIPEILLVDNASTDATLARTFPSKVTIIKNNLNLGTSGAVAIGMEYGLAHGYDWIYILDADSSPQPEAIEKLVRCYEGLSPELKASTWWLSSLLKDDGGRLHHGCIITPRGIEMVQPPPEPSYYPCDTNMWSGSFYRLDAAQKVGLPNRDFVLDWGDVIYGYEGMIRGYTGFVDQSSIVMHNLHPFDTLHFRRFGMGLVKLFYSPPMRCYYHWRNSVYFWLYVYSGNKLGRPTICHIVMFVKWLIKVSLFIKNPGPILRACFLGMWDGIHGRLENRYGSTAAPTATPAAPAATLR
jgi:GT2 family glycosyltransferase